MVWYDLIVDIPLSTTTVPHHMPSLVVSGHHLSMPFILIPTPLIGFFINQFAHCFPIAIVLTHVSSAAVLTLHTPCHWNPKTRHYSQYLPH